MVSLCVCPLLSATSCVQETCHVQIISQLLLTWSDFFRGSVILISSTHGAQRVRNMHVFSSRVSEIVVMVTAATPQCVKPLLLSSLINQYHIKFGV